MESTELLNYYRNVLPNCYFKENNYTQDELKKIRIGARNKVFEVYKTIVKKTKYNARSWNNQLQRRFLLHYPNRRSGTLIECMSIIHYLDTSIIDLTVELSNMYNCVVGCRFCASGALPGCVKYLEPFDYVKQLNTCLIESGIDPEDYDNFYVSFAGIGEPSVVYNNLSLGMMIIRDLYPNVKFNIATFGYRIECFQFWNKLCLPIRTLQLPLYHIDTKKLSGIVTGLPSGYDLLEVIEQAVWYKINHSACRIKVNYIPMKNVNDGDGDVNRFIKKLEPFKQDITVKISFLNYTKPAEDNGFVTSGLDRLREIEKLFIENGFSTYIFGTDENTTLGCGQLAQNHISGD